LFKNYYRNLSVNNVTDDTQTPPVDLEFQVSYPSSVYDFSNNDIDPKPISVWLQATQPVTNSPPLTYSVILSANEDDLIFVDENNLPATNEAVTSATSWPHEPLIFYICQNTGNWTTTVLTAEVINPAFPNQKLTNGEIAVNIQSPFKWQIFLARFLHILFGQPLTLASTAVALIAFAIQQQFQRQEKLHDIQRQEKLQEIERQEKLQEIQHQEKLQEIERQEKLNERDLQQKQKEIDNLSNLLNMNFGRGIRQWWEFTQWAKGFDPNRLDWQKPELQTRLNDLWSHDIKDRKWQEELLKEAVGYLNSGKTEEATDRANLIHKIDTANPTAPSNALIAARLFAAYASNNKGQVINIANESDIDTAIKATWWLYTEFDSRESKSIIEMVVVQTLAELVSHPETIKFASEVLRGDEDGLHLLKRPEFGEALNRFTTENPQSEHLELARSLQEIRKEPYNWPQLWPFFQDNKDLTQLWPHCAARLSSPDDIQILNWLLNVIKRVPTPEYRYNPFVSKVELEPHFVNYHINRSILGAITGSHPPLSPIVLFGNDGSGKTATAILLIRDYLKFKDGTFPVYYSFQEPLDADPTAPVYLDLLLRAYGESLLNFLVLNPHSYLDQTENQKSAMAYLLTYCAGSPSNMIMHLQQTQLANNSTGRHLIKRLTEKNRNVPRHLAFTQQMLLAMLGQARPYNFQHTNILLDISTRSLPAPSHAKYLQPFIDLMMPLAKHNVYLTMIAPLAVKNDLYRPPEVMTSDLTWTPSNLKKLLDARTQSEQTTSFDSFFNQQEVSDPTDRLIAAADNSPTRLIELVRRLLIQASREPSSDENKKISNQTLETVLEAAAKEPPHE